MKPLNREFRIVFQPYEAHPLHSKRRFAVGAYSLHKYIGWDNAETALRRDNAETALRRALAFQGDICSVKFRAHGVVQFYYK